ncbi:TM0106 family RecB-like putative nuclease [Synechococcus sp. WH 8016]|uniref:TM0106 family RecB-like putative nuclease n=1 Tax=Synechococcus sp. WH 8016 TaxID=166318 RepID=UPI00022D8E50|nr:TM0106 family RecB-like putative nuclease [Synechococcus sp. WH 8016]EHA62281.1 RecB family nuclease, putative [Synechococcus sp. WH 8016]
MGATPLADKPLTDRLLRSWVRCRRRAWLDRHANPDDRLYTAHRTLQLDDQQRSFVALLPGKPGHGQAACERGEPGVVGVRLSGVFPDVSAQKVAALEAHPPLLERVKGSSRWGEFAYRPVIARQGRRLTREHRLQLALAGRLLAEFQGGPVPDGLAVAGSGRRLERERLPLGNSLNRQLDEALLRLSADLTRTDPPALAADRRKCTLCSWRGLCNDVASQEGHLSEVSGIGAKRREMLQDIGVNSLQALAAANTTDLAGQLKRFGEQHAAMAAPLVAQARAQRDGVVERLDAFPAIPELLNAPGVLLYDIESDPDARDDFLHGFVRLPKNGGQSWDLTRATYHPLLVLQEHGEKRCWQRIQRFLATYPDWLILHYGETESLALLRMAKRQGASDQEQQALRERLIDVHARLRAHWRLPLSSYGLKAVAGWRGFKWGQSGADGARALLWWRQWRGEGVKARGSSHALRWILTYNRDDGLATWAVAQWLLSGDQGLV